MACKDVDEDERQDRYLKGTQRSAQNKRYKNTKDMIALAMTILCELVRTGTVLIKAIPKII